MSKTGRATEKEQEPAAWWRAWLAGILVAVAAVALLGAVVTRYVQRNILDTQGFIAVVGPLPQNPAVATALANFTTSRIFNAVNTESELRQFLPPKLSGLASPLNDTLQRSISQAAKAFIQSDAFNAIWIAANQTMQKSVVALAESKKPEGKMAQAAGSLDLSQLASEVRQRVGGEGVLNSQKLNQATTVHIDLQQRVDRLRTTVSIIKGGAHTLPILSVALLLAAVAIAYNRRHTITAIGITILLLGLAALIAFKVWSGHFLSTISNATYQAGATAAYEAFYGHLRLRLILTVAFGAALIILAAIAGPYTWAGRLRRTLAIDKFRNIRPYQWSLSLRRWTAKYEIWIDLAALAVAIIWLLILSSLTPGVLVVVLGLLVGFVSLIHLIARPAPNTA